MLTINPFDAAAIVDNAPDANMDVSKERVVLVFPRPADSDSNTLTTFNSTWGVLMKDVHSRILTVPIDDQGRIFIERDPSVFPLILKFLEGKTDTEEIKALSAEKKQLLKNDIIFYNLKSFQNLTAENGSLQWTEEEMGQILSSPVMHD